MMIFDDTKPWNEKLTRLRPALDWANPAVQPTIGAPFVVQLQESEPLKAECRHFLEASATRAVPRTDGAESLAVVRLIERAQASLKAGGIAH